MSVKSLRVLFLAIGAVLAVLLSQTDVPLDPAVHVALVALNAALAAIGPELVMVKLGPSDPVPTTAPAPAPSDPPAPPAA